MPRGVYPRKKKTAEPRKPGRKSTPATDEVSQALAVMRAADRVVAFGTAIEALEVLET